MAGFSSHRNWSSKEPLWLLVFIPTMQEHTWFDLFNQLNCLYIVDLLDQMCSCLVEMKTCSHSGPLLDQFDIYLMYILDMLQPSLYSPGTGQWRDCIKTKFATCKNFIKPLKYIISAVDRFRFIMSQIGYSSVSGFWCIAKIAKKCYNCPWPPLHHTSYKCYIWAIFFIYASCPTSAVLVCK